MATFDLNSINRVIGNTAYKFYIQNHTKETGIYYDVGMLTKGVDVYWVSGPRAGIVGPGGSAVCNFDLLAENDPRFLGVPDGLKQFITTRIKRERVSMLNVNNTPVLLRFWEGGGASQYINFIQEGPVRVTRDTSEFNEVRFNQYRLTLDSGGHNNDTMDIFFQLYDA